MASDDEAGGYRGRLGGRVHVACCMSAWLPQTCSDWLCEVRPFWGTFTAAGGSIPVMIRTELMNRSLSSEIFDYSYS